MWICQSESHVKYIVLLKLSLLRCCVIPLTYCRNLVLAIPIGISVEASFSLQVLVKGLEPFSLLSWVLFVCLWVKLGWDRIMPKKGCIACNRVYFEGECGIRRCLSLTVGFIKRNVICLKLKIEICGWTRINGWVSKFI